MSKVIFSPHIDDAFFSLGGSILNWGDVVGEDVIVVNVFSKSNFTSNGLKDVDEVTQLRKQEELKNVEVSGSKVKFIDFPEALLRGHKWVDTYPQNIVDTDLEYVEKIKQVILKYNCEGNELFFPLAIGNHTDHQIVHKAVIELISDGVLKVEYVFYEDLPYANSFSLPDLVENLGLVPFQEQIDIDKKLKLCENYTSQRNEEWLKSIKDHAFSPQKQEFFERIWKK